MFSSLSLRQVFSVLVVAVLFAAPFSARAETPNEVLLSYVSSLKNIVRSLEGLLAISQTYSNRVVAQVATSTPVAPTVSVWATPATINNGQSSALGWSGSHATACSFDDGYSGGGSGGSHSVSPTVTTTYTITCTGDGGSVSKTVKVTVTGAVPPTSTLSASATAINSGDSVTLTWSSTNTTSCTGTNFDTASAKSGSVSDTPLADTTYSISCTGTGGTTSKSVTVTVAQSAGAQPATTTPPAATTTPSTPAPTATFWGTPTLITSGQSSALGWSSSNATACTISDGFSGGTAGSHTVLPTVTTTYTLTCTGSGGSISKTVTVSVSGGSSSSSSTSTTTGTTSGSATTTTTGSTSSAPTATFWSSPSLITSGQSSTLGWSSSGATSCSIDDGFSGGAGGSHSVSPTKTTVYTLTCTGAGGSVSKMLTITVSGSSSSSGTSSTTPTVKISAQPASINLGASVLISWNSTNTSACTGINFSTGSATSGSLTLTPVGNTTYSISCAGSVSGSATNAVTVSVAGGTPPSTVTVGPGSLQIGVFSGGFNPTAAANFEAWSGRTSAYNVDFFSDTGFSGSDNIVANAGWLVGVWAAANRPDRNMLFSVPLSTKQDRSLANVAAGNYDTMYQSVARSVASHYPNAVIRIGWEFNGGWYSWAANGRTQDYINAFRHVAAIFKAASPTFVIDWCTNFGTQQFAPEKAYPGDDVVDEIGMDVYDASWSLADRDPVYRWNAYLTDSRGLNWLAAFAGAHNKPIAIPEWATGGTNTGDNAYFIDQMYNWIVTHNVVRASYWNSSSAYNGSLATSTHTMMAAAYLSSFAQYSATNAGPVAVAAPVSVPVISQGSGTSSQNSTSAPSTIDSQIPYYGGGGGGGGAAASSGGIRMYPGTYVGGPTTANVPVPNSTLGGSSAINGGGSSAQAAYEKYLFYRALALGSTGDDVKKLQQFLGVNPTGYFGDLTKTAVMNFQKQSGIVATGGGAGVVGPYTMLKLNSLLGTSSPLGGGTISGSAQSSHNSEPAATINISTSGSGSVSGVPFTRTIGVGAVGADVKALQQFLNDQGFVITANGPGSPGNESTYFGPKTAQALKKFQEAHQEELLAPVGLTSGTGVLGPRTLKKIKDSLNEH